MIVDDGIDEHFSNLNGLFGAGAYFTDRSSKADQVLIVSLKLLTI